jgi:hypothetical protein
LERGLLNEQHMDLRGPRRAVSPLPSSKRIYGHTGYTRCEMPDLNGWKAVDPLSRDCARIMIACAVNGVGALDVVVRTYPKQPIKGHWSVTHQEYNR